MLTDSIIHSRYIARRNCCPASDLKSEFFGLIARLNPEVPAHDALRLAVDTYEGRKPMTSWQRPPDNPRKVWLNNVQKDANAVPLSTLWRSQIAPCRDQGAAQRSLGLRDEDAFLLFRFHPSPLLRLGGLESGVSPPSGVRGGVPGANAFLTILTHDNTSGDNKFN